jgi:hypothetical protein
MKEIKLATTEDAIKYMADYSQDSKMPEPTTTVGFIRNLAISAGDDRFTEIIVKFVTPHLFDGTAGYPTVEEMNELVNRFANTFDAYAKEKRWGFVRHF